MKNKTLKTAVALALLGVSTVTTAKVLEGGDTVTLKGTVSTKMAYGAPNYGEDPKHDEKVYMKVLNVSKSFNFTSDPTGDIPKVKSVRILNDRKFGELKNGSCYVVKGELWGKDTARLIMDVSIDPESVKPCK